MKKAKLPKTDSIQKLAEFWDTHDLTEFENIRRSELQRLESKLGNLPPEARARVDEVTRLIVEKLLLEPTEQLKALPDEETQAAYTEAINRIFKLQGQEIADPERQRK